MDPSSEAPTAIDALNRLPMTGSVSGPSGNYDVNRLREAVRSFSNGNGGLDAIPRVPIDGSALNLRQMAKSEVLKRAAAEGTISHGVQLLQSKEMRDLKSNSHVLGAIYWEKPAEPGQLPLRYPCVEVQGVIDAEGKIVKLGPYQTYPEELQRKVDQKELSGFSLKIPFASLRKGMPDPGGQVAEVFFDDKPVSPRKKHLVLTRTVQRLNESISERNKIPKIEPYSHRYDREGNIIK